MLYVFKSDIPDVDWDASYCSLFSAEEQSKWALTVSGSVPVSLETLEDRPSLPLPVKVGFHLDFTMEELVAAFHCEEWPVVVK